jgi:N utilization substance protein B
MHDRRVARKLALEILYEREISGIDWRVAADRRLGPDIKKPAADFCRHILKGLDSHQEALNKLIEEYTKNWALDRLPLVDRNILRIAMYEMVYEPSIPGRVSINEAVDLAKEYGGIDSSKFINGVLGQLIINLEGVK